MNLDVAMFRKGAKNYRTVEGEAQDRNLHPNLTQVVFKDPSGITRVLCVMNLTNKR